MNWIKRGRIYACDATSPVVDNLGDRWRIYHSYRDAANRSRIAFVDVEPFNPHIIINVNKSPVIPLGNLGSFDECGTMPTWIETIGSTKYLYYIGWSVKSTVPFDNHTGLAISYDGDRWKKYPGPVLGKTHEEPYFTGTIGVLRENGVWRGWYMSGTKWVRQGGRAEPYYNIKYAESVDGIHWKRKNTVCIDFKDANEAGICKACVLPCGSSYEMYYSYRQSGDYRDNPRSSYRIGYAISSDGLHWERIDDLEDRGLGLSVDGWDSKMICMPHILRFDRSTFMFYNGNAFGREGIGYAELQK